ncbi:MAG TPA: peptidoglycan-binding protein [Chthoniobacteraceae bacterium]|nr:peptidoglycan-binding protein [Chthoniobacteraceae bacterium]
MKLAKYFPLVPALSAVCLLAAPSTGLSHDHHWHHHGGVVIYGGSPYYGYGYPYYSGPTFSFNFSRSYSPGYEDRYSDDLAVDVQRALRRRGYYRGAIDGDIGAGTRAAIRDYQYDRGLAPTGRIDHSLLRSLGIG